MELNDAYNSDEDPDYVPTAAEIRKAAKAEYEMATKYGIRSNEVIRSESNKTHHEIVSHESDTEQSKHTQLNVQAIADVKVLPEKKAKGNNNISTKPKSRSKK